MLFSSIFTGTFIHLTLNGMSCSLGAFFNWREVFFIRSFYVSDLSVGSGHYLCQGEWSQVWEPNRIRIISFYRGLILDQPSCIFRLQPEWNSAVKKLNSVGRQWGDSGLHTLMQERRQKHLAQSTVAAPM